MPDLNPAFYQVVWIAPMQIEAQAALHMLDNRHDGRFPMSKGDDYVFLAGDMMGHNIAIATLPAGQEYGTGSAAALASQTKKFFPNLWFALLVGVAAGLPNLSRKPARDIRLGDVLIALPEGDSSGLLGYDLGKKTAGNGFQLLQHGHILASTETVIRSAIMSIRLRTFKSYEIILKHYEALNKKHEEGGYSDPGQENDMLYETTEDGTERLVSRQLRVASERTRVWYGPIGSGEKVVNNALVRDQLRDKYDLIGLEMEAAGIMNHIPVGVIRGVGNYADAHKNNEWQAYAAAMAAAYAKAILYEISPGRNSILGPPEEQLDAGALRLMFHGPIGARNVLAENSTADGRVNIISSESV